LAFRYNDPDSFTRFGLVDYVSGGAPGDFDGDSDVDGADFLVWQRGVGTNHNAATLTTWKASFGAGGATGAVAAVPEPNSVLLAGLAMMGASVVRQRFPIGC
jgi:hypothetical protein